jgi:hypothetical protein
MTDDQLRASVKDAFIDVEMARCGIMEGVERIMAAVARFERGEGAPPTAYPLYERTSPRPLATDCHRQCDRCHDVTNYYLEGEDEEA